MIVPTFRLYTKYLTGPSYAQGGVIRGTYKDIKTSLRKSENRNIVDSGDKSLPVIIEHQTGNLFNNPQFFNTAYSWNINGPISIDANRFPNSLGSRVLNITTSGTSQTYLDKTVNFQQVQTYRPGDYFLVSFKIKKPIDSSIGNTLTKITIAETSPIVFWLNQTIGDQLVPGQFSHVLFAVTPPVASTTLKSISIAIYIHSTSFSGSAETWQVTEPSCVFCSRGIPMFDIDTKLKLNAAPTDGSWLVGDKVYNIAPAASGYEGWVCTAAGTPGTWKGFGVIQA